MHPAPELPRNLAGRRLGRYEVLTQLASGGMAAVYIARAVGVAGFERLVAIKVLHPHLAYEEEFISMFLDEARVAASIRHPNVVPTLDISDTEGDGFFLVMEYIEGDHFGSLLGEAARGGERVPAPVSIRVLLDALGGLGAAHRLCDEYGERLNLVHRDVSPHNILVGTDGIARLTDFGVAKAEKRLTSTRAGQLKGKLAYMSPEQASTGAVDQRSDLFSMGVIVWEALTGRRLFRAENNGATLNKILHEPIPLPSELWDDLDAYDAVMAKALDRDPDARFQTAEDFAAALEEAADAHAGIARAREVESSVRSWLGERVDERRERIREASAHGRSDYSEAAIPIPIDSSDSITASGSRNAVGIPAESSLTLSLEEPVSEEAPAGPDRRLVGALIMMGALVFGGGLAWMLAPGGEREPEVTTSNPPSAAETTEPQAQQAPEATEPEAEVEAQEPEPEVAAEAEAEPEPEAEAPGRTVRNRRRDRRRDRPAAEPVAEAATPEPEPEPEPVAEAEPEPAPMRVTPMRPTPMRPTPTNDLELNPYR